MARRGNMANGLPARACFQFRCIIADRRPSVTSVCEKTVCSFITDEETSNAHADAVTRYSEAIRAMWATS
jgi:hypothetical protein